MFLPATQSSGNPRPIIQSILHVLFPFDYLLKSIGIDDFYRVPVNLVSVILWGVLIAYLSCKVFKIKKQNNSNEAVHRTANRSR